MSRPIRDEVVDDRAVLLNFNRVYIDNIPKYLGSVNEKQTKVSLRDSDIGLASYGICSPLKEKYKSLRINDTDGIVVAFGAEYPCNVEVVKMIKALALEQINRNDEYSQVIGQICAALIMHATKQAVISEMPSNPDYTPVQATVFGEVIDFVCGELGIVRSPTVEVLEG